MLRFFVLGIFCCLFVFCGGCLRFFACVGFDVIVNFVFLGWRHVGCIVFSFGLVVVLCFLVCFLVFFSFMWFGVRAFFLDLIFSWVC